MRARNFSVILTVLGLFPATGSALGIRLFDHDAFATARGDAFVATADNASAIYYNPAGISQLKGHNTRAALSLVNVDSDFKGRSGRDTSVKEDWILLPGFFYTYSPSNCPISLGLGYYMPFGLALEWPETAPFRTTTIYGELQYHTVNPIIAWQVTETLSIGAGPTLNYASTELRRGIAITPDEFKFTGDDYDFGASAGILWQLFKRHSFGLSYRSQTTMNLDGESRVQPAAYLIPKQDASAKLPFPQVIIVGYSFRPTPHWNLEVDFDWTDWDRVNTPVLKQATGDVPLPLRWDSSYAIEFGVTRYFDNGMHLSGGYVYIESSVPNKSFTPLVPDQDLHVFSAGLGGKYKRLAWDATYQFTYGPGHDVAGSVYGPDVAGNYDFIAHAFRLSLGYSF